jgi:hypothetical protein
MRTVGMILIVVLIASCKEKPKNYTCTCTFISQYGVEQNSGIVNGTNEEARNECAKHQEMAQRHYHRIGHVTCSVR